MKTKVMVVMFQWEGQYYSTLKELPVAGLKALRDELKQIRAMQGYSFKDEDLLQNVESTLYHRLGVSSR